MTDARIPLADRAAWEAALRGVPHAFAHTWGSCHAMSLTSGLETFLYVHDDGAHRVVCPLSVRTFAGQADVLTPYGFSGFATTGPCPEFPERWAAWARAQGFVCGYVGLNPALDPALPFPAGDRHVHGTVRLLDLAVPEPELIAGLSENRRRQLRRWAGGEARLVTDRARLAGFFAAELATFLADRRAARAYYLSAATVEALAALDEVLLLGVERQGRLEAVSMFASTAWVGDFLFNVSIPEGREHSAALIWEGALRLRAMGVPMLNLGGGIRPGDGVEAFKARFGGRLAPLAALKQVYDRDAFAALCVRAGVDPHDRDGYFPPYHAR